MPVEESSEVSLADGWEPVRQHRTYEHVLQAIEDQILLGRFAPGDRLPSERDLAAMLEVSRPSVREAMRVLEWMGVIVGSGKSAGSVVTNRVSDALSRVLRVHLALASFGLDDVVEARVALETASVVGATRNATPGDLDRLAAIVEQMEAAAATATPPEFNKLDTDFHLSIAEVSGNRLLAETMLALRDVVQQEMVRAFGAFRDWRQVAQQLCSEHRHILDAIATGNGVHSRQRMAAHITDFYTQVKDPLLREGANGDSTEPTLRDGGARHADLRPR